MRTNSVGVDNGAETRRHEGRASVSVSTHHHVVRESRPERGPVNIPGSSPGTALSLIRRTPLGVDGGLSPLPGLVIGNDDCLI